MKILIFISSLLFCFTGFSDGQDMPKYFKKAERKIFKFFGVADYTYDLLKKDASKTKQLFVINESGEKKGLLFFGSTQACVFGGCAKSKSQHLEIEQDDIHFFAILDNSGVLVDLAITDFESTYGYEVSSRSWLSQFLEQSPGDYVLNKNIDGITGATISCESMVESLNLILDF